MDFLFTTKSFSLLYFCDDISVSGSNYTLMSKKYVIKVINKFRQKSIDLEYSDFNLIEFTSFEEAKNKFILANKKEAFIKNDMLYMERIDAKNLSLYLNSKIFLNLVEKSFLRLKELSSKHNFSHTDFHLENILVDDRENIYFIDFDYKYRSNIAPYEMECDILKFLYFFKKYYSPEYKHSKSNLSSLVFNHFDRARLFEAKKLMNNYLEGNLDELFD